MANLPDEQISHDELHFQRRATIARIHAAVLSVFVGRCRNCGFSMVALSMRLDRPIEDVRKLLDKPEKWSLDTISDLMLAMDCEFNVQIRQLLFSDMPAAHEQEQAHG